MSELIKEQKKQISIYAIDKKSHIFNNENIDINTIVSAIEHECNEKNYEFENLSIDTKKFEGYATKAILVKNKKYNKWQKYINQLLTKELDIKPETLTSILILLESNKEKNMYAVNFGMTTYCLIKDMVSESFGLEILSRIANTNETMCKASKEQSLTGIKQGQINTYREWQSLENTGDDFGRIFKELLMSIDIRLLEKFGIEKSKKKFNEFRSCLIKNSFRINKALPPENIKKLIDGCEWAMTQKSKPVNSVKILHKKQDEILISKLEKNFYESLWSNFQNEQGSYKYDLVHKDFDKYFTAVTFAVRAKGINFIVSEPIVHIDMLFKLLKESKKDSGEPIDNELFQDFIKNGKIITYDEEDQKVTEESILKHIFAEETMPNNKKYFLLNGIWYHLRNEFINMLDDRIKNIYKNYENEDKKFLHKWDSCATEGEYVEKHKSKSNTIIIHPNKIDNIEFCDIIHYDENNTYLYFIKQGFGNEIRSLASQINITAKLLQHELSDKKYLKKLYKQIEKNNATNLSEKEFYQLFDKKIVFVFAFRDINKNERSLKLNPESFNSNIAKYSLLNLFRDMQAINSNIQIYQIEK